MKKGAYIVNISRGGIVDTEALVEAIQNGTISGAGLDVLEDEHLPVEHPIWHLSNVYITPHTTPQVPNRAKASIEIIAENKRRFEAGEPMLNLMTEKDRFTSGNNQSGFARLMNTKMSKEEIAKLPLEKFLGRKDWKDQSEWDSID